MAKPGSDRDGAMVDKQAGKKVCEHTDTQIGTEQSSKKQIYLCVYSLRPPTVFNG